VQAIDAFQKVRNARAEAFFFTEDANADLTAKLFVWHSDLH
jgi:hypothetical protein